ncbi:MAG: hypothetical protein ACI4EG_13485 [Fusicatenibacter sp.]|nr:hypothetical protein [Fusicatenibacter sp.]
MKKAGKALIAAAGLMLMSALFTVNMTGAFFTDSEKLQNRFTVGCITTEIEEEFPTPDPLDPEKPSDILKSASVRNQTGVICYVRMAVVFEGSDAGEGFTLTDVDLEHWVDGQDGFFYYLTPLSSGEATTPLFSGIHYDGEGMKNSSQDTRKVICYEESVQAEHEGIPFENYQAAWNFYEGKEKSEVMPDET